MLVLQGSRMGFQESFLVCLHFAEAKWQKKCFNVAV